MKQDKRSRRSQAFLIDTLLDLLEEKEYGRITIRELAEKANIARQTFYRNFTSKDDILLHQMDEIFAEYFKTVKETLGKKGGIIFRRRASNWIYNTSVEDMKVTES